MKNSFDIDENYEQDIIANIQEMVRVMRETKPRRYPMADPVMLKALRDLMDRELGWHWMSLDEQE